VEKVQDQTKKEEKVIPMPVAAPESQQAAPAAEEGAAKEK
jgi:hypothetical protein